MGMPEYSEHRGIVIRKYRNFWGSFVLVLQEGGGSVKVNTGKGIYENCVIGGEYTIGKTGRKLVNIRQGTAENRDGFIDQ